MTHLCKACSHGCFVLYCLNQVLAQVVVPWGFGLQQDGCKPSGYGLLRLHGQQEKSSQLQLGGAAVGTSKLLCNTQLHGHLSKSTFAWT